MKTTLRKRLAALALTLVLVIGLLPAISLPVSASDHELDYGFKLSVLEIRTQTPYEVNGNQLYPENIQIDISNIENHEVTVTIDAIYPLSYHSASYKRDISAQKFVFSNISCNEKYEQKLKISYQELGFEAPSTGSGANDITYTEWQLYLKLTRDPGHHLTSAQSNGEVDGVFVSTHTGRCALCGESVTENCSSSTEIKCDEYPTCSVCGGNFEKKDHELQYALNGENGILETCKNCSHRATMSLSLISGADLTYTGRPVAPVQVGYASAWLGEKVTLLTYNNNINAGAASASLTCEGITVTQKFTIAKKPVSFAFPEAANSITYGQKLSDVRLTFDSNEYGTFAWYDPNYISPFNDPSCAVVFTPYRENYENYDFSGFEGWDANTQTVSRLTGITMNPAAGDLTVSIDDWQYGDPASIPTFSSTSLNDRNVTNDIAPAYTYVGRNGTNYTESSEPPSLPGEYTLKATLSEGKFNGHTIYTAVTATCDFEITPRNITVTVENKSKTYGTDDPKFTYTTEGGVVGTDRLNIIISRTAGENVGTYDIIAAEPDGANPCYDITFENGTFTITPATLHVRADGKTKIYGDADPALTYTVVEGLANGDTAAVITGALTRTEGENVGEYTIGLGTLSAENYTIDYQDAKLVINQKTLTITAHDKTMVYGEAYPELTYSVSGLANGDSNAVITGELSRQAGDDAGTYAIVLGTLDAGNNYVISFTPGTLTIAPAPARVLTAPTSASLTYDGNQLDLIHGGTAEGGTMVYALSENGSYSDTIPTAINAGPYKVWYYVDGDSNHSDTEKAFVEVTIEKADPGIGAVSANVVSDTLETSAIILSRVNTDVPGTLTVDNGQSLQLGDNHVAWTFTPDDAGNYESVAGTVLVTVQDTLPPTGTVSMAMSTWDRFLYTITFGIYCPDTQYVTVDAQDSFSGLQAVEYLESHEALSYDQVSNSTNWNAYPDGGVEVTLEDAKQFVYYIRVTDKAGNMLFLSTDGAEYDITAPVIAGVEDGVTCYTTQVISVTDKNLDSVTVNGTPVYDPANFTLPGNKDVVYTVVAIDKAGNSTELTVNMLPIADIGEAMEDLDLSNVTSDDSPALRRIIATAEELLEDEDLTDEEKAALEDMKENAQELIDRVDEAAEASATEDILASLDTNKDNVTHEDKDTLSGAKEDLEYLLDEYGGNLTEDETALIEDVLTQITDALAVIESAEEAEDAVKALPETVEPDDLDTAEKILAAEEAYEALSEQGKSLVSEDAAEKLKVLLAALTDYKIISGDKFLWDADDADHTITANGAFSKFVKLLVDGNVVAPENYEAKSGSTVVTLKASYLDTLSVGKHTITFVYTDGETAGSFEITALSSGGAGSSTPDTGDSSNIALYASLLALSLAALTALVLVLKKRKA